MMYGGTKLFRSHYGYIVYLLQLLHDTNPNKISAKFDERSFESTNPSLTSPIDKILNTKWKNRCFPTIAELKI